MPTIKCVHFHKVVEAETENASLYFIELVLEDLNIRNMYGWAFITDKENV